jgi:hypothetical protein
MCAQLLMVQTSSNAGWTKYAYLTNINLAFFIRFHCDDCSCVGWGPRVDDDCSMFISRLPGPKPFLLKKEKKCNEYSYMGTLILHCNSHCCYNYAIKQSLAKLISDHELLIIIFMTEDPKSKSNACMKFSVYIDIFRQERAYFIKQKVHNKQTCMLRWSTKHTFQNMTQKLSSVFYFQLFLSEIQKRMQSRQHFSHVTVWLFTQTLHKRNYWHLIVQINKNKIVLLFFFSSDIINCNKNAMERKMIRILIVFANKFFSGKSMMRVVY